MKNRLDKPFSAVWRFFVLPKIPELMFIVYFFGVLPLFRYLSHTLDQPTKSEAINKQKQSKGTQSDIMLFCHGFVTVLFLSRSIFAIRQKQIK